MFYGLGGLGVILIILYILQIISWTLTTQIIVITTIREPTNPQNIDHATWVYSPLSFQASQGIL